MVDYGKIINYLVIYFSMKRIIVSFVNSKNKN
jgi:hypothetical protein